MLSFETGGWNVSYWTTVTCRSEDCASIYIVYCVLIFLFLMFSGKISDVTCARQAQLSALHSSGFVVPAVLSYSWPL